MKRGGGVLCEVPGVKYIKAMKAKALKMSLLSGVQGHRRSLCKDGPGQY
jgi:hypothetical protein